MQELIVQESFDLKKAKTWNMHDANLILYSVLTEAASESCLQPDRAVDTVRSSNSGSKQSLLPPEIVLQILQHPSRWILTSSSSVRFGEPGKVYSGGGYGLEDYVPGYDFPVKIAHSKVLSAKEAKQIRKVVLTFKGGRRCYPKHLKAGSSWSSLYEVAINSHTKDHRLSCAFDIWWRGHVTEETDNYRFEYAGDHELMAGLSEGDWIDVEIRTPNWFLVREASFEIWCVDDLSMGGDMKWVEDEVSTNTKIMTSGCWGRPGGAGETSRTTGKEVLK